MKTKKQNLNHINSLVNQVNCKAVHFQPERPAGPIIVLDDDPTGTQTVHDVMVYTDWTERTLAEAFEQPLAFILTNSRSFSAEKTAAEHKSIAERLKKVANGRSFLLISRGDSTLRGHYPLETQTLAKALGDIDGEVICPFFPEGGRYTYGDVHYVAQGEELIPAGQTEFGADKTFGYTSSHLGEWAEEKTRGAFKAADMLYIAAETLRAGDVDAVLGALLQARDFNKIIVNALSYADLDCFVTALAQALREGKRFLYRTAAAFVKAIGGISSIPLLTKRELVGDSAMSGLIVAGSHVKKTTAQLEKLLELPYVENVVFDQHLIQDAARTQAEIRRVTEICDTNIAAGKLTLVATRRDRLDVGGSPEEELAIAVRISGALTAVVSGLTQKPAFLLAKGGITSSDIGVKGLRIHKARVMGQILPGVPVWQSGSGAKFPNMPYIIFPGNVGAEDALKIIAENLH